MKKLLNFKTAFIVMAVCLATFSGVKGYQYVTDFNGITAFLLENAEALAQGEGTGSLKLDCRPNNVQNSKCFYRCSCGRLYENPVDGKERTGVSGVCVCGTPGKN